MSSELPPPPLDDALGSALREVLGPLARLAVARGVSHATLDELLKQTLVQAGDQLYAELPAHRRVSRITTATGIHRREVSRLISLLRGEQPHSAGAAPVERSHASELFTRWRTDPAYADRRGSPAELPRQGPPPSFETLAQGITRDVHPRSLLDELLRLGLAAHDGARDTVRLVREAFVPQGDEGRMLRVLGRNVGSHLNGAVDNLLQDVGRRHFEQALFASGLSDASMLEFRRRVSELWQDLLASMVPALQAMVARDALPAAPSPPSTPSALSTPSSPQHQLRLGLYTFEQAMPPQAEP